MRHLIYITIVFSLSLAACIDSSSDGTANQVGIADTSAEIKTTSLQGIYIEGQGIYTCPSGDLYTVEGAFLEKIKAAKQHYLNEYSAEGKTFYVEVTAAALATSKRMVINSVDSIAPMNAFNCCVPYDYWCSGTEPFWDFVISEKMGTALCFDMGVLNAECQYAAPTTLPDGTVHYRLPMQSKPGSIEVLIQKKPCSDGMSDRDFSYQTEVRSANRVLQGCAVTFGTAKWEEQ